MAPGRRKIQHLSSNWNRPNRPVSTGLPYSGPDRATSLSGMPDGDFYQRVRSARPYGSELADPLGPELAENLNPSGIEFSITNDINQVLSDLDVIYMNSIAFLGDSYKTPDSRFKLNSGSNLKKDMVVLHPLARLDEPDPMLDETSHNLYFTQAHGAAFVRQALFISILNCFDQLPDQAFPLIVRACWGFSARSKNEGFFRQFSRF